MASKKQIHALIGYFLTKYALRYKRELQINRFREQWAFDSMITDLGYERALEVIDYYFEMKKPGHPLQYLLYNYDKISVTIKELADDEEDRRKLREETEKRVAEWERTNLT